MTIEMFNSQPKIPEKPPKKEEEKRIEEVLTRGVVEVVDRDHLRKRMLRGEILRVKMGIDPTGPNIHIGRGASILKLRDFQKLGHQIVLIIGDATAMVGDSSDKTSERSRLTPEQVALNEKNYLQQIGRILDISRVEVHHNSEWIRKMDFNTLFQLASQFSVQQVIERENYAQRLKEGNTVGLHEILYPLLQGWDSVNVRADLEIGGTDQLFNLNAGRKIQSRFGQSPQDIMTLMLLAGTDGRKMSTSWGNVILIVDSPQEKYGKIMRIPDYLIPVYMECATRIPMERVTQIGEKLKGGSDNPMIFKKELAFSVVELYDGKQAAQEAQREFEKLIQNKELPEVFPVGYISGQLSQEKLVRELVKSNLVRSKSEAKRLIEQGGVSVDGKRFSSEQVISVPKRGVNIKVGNRRFLKIESSFEEGGE